MLCGCGGWEVLSVCMGEVLETKFFFLGGGDQGQQLKEV